MNASAKNPDARREFELRYPGKLSEANILAAAEAPLPFRLRVDKIFPGEEPSLFDGDWRNLLVFSDNLLFLQAAFADRDPLLRGKIKGKVRLIYIDPPFGTGLDYGGNRGQHAYSARMRGPDFIEFLRRRLILAREILADDGVVVVRNAYNYGHYVKIILDEIFSMENFVNEIIIRRKRKSIGTVKKYEVANEYLYIYSKSGNYHFENQLAHKPLSKIKWTSFLSQEERHPKERTVLGLTFLPPPGQHFSLNQAKTEKLLREHFLRVKHRSGVLFYYSETGTDAEFYRTISTKGVNRFKYQDITTETEVYGVRDIREIPKFRHTPVEEFKIEYLTRDQEKVTNDWTDIPSYSDTVGYPTENSELLLKRVILSFTQPGDLVMDFFAGSGTTPAVAEKLGRRWVAADFGKFACSVILRRLLRIQDSKDLANPRRKYGKRARPFLVLRFAESEERAAAAFWEAGAAAAACRLFGAEFGPFETEGMHFDGRKDGLPVLVLDRRPGGEFPLDPDALNVLAEKIAPAAREVFLIVPEDRAPLWADSLELDGLVVHFLKVPAELLRNLSGSAGTQSGEEPTETDRGHPAQLARFHLVVPPRVRAEIRSGGDGLELRVREFRSRDPQTGAAGDSSGLEALAYVLVDTRPGQKPFVIRRAFSAGEMRREEGETRLQLDSLVTGGPIRAIFVDIYGNECRQELPVQRGDS